MKRTPIASILVAMALQTACVETQQPCEYASADEAGDPFNPEFCEISPEITVNGGFVRCGGSAFDKTLEHLSDLQAVSFGVPDYRPDDEDGYSYAAIVDGREPGPVGPQDYRALVEAVVEYEDPELGTRMGMMGRICCPQGSWFYEYPDNFGELASPQCQDAFGDGQLFPDAYCLPMPDAPWPGSNVPLGYTPPETGGLCVYLCNEDVECPGYDQGLHFCQLPAFDGMLTEFPTEKLGACRNVNYPDVPTPLVSQPLRAHLEMEISL